MQQSVLDQLVRYISEAERPLSIESMRGWSQKVSTFIQSALGDDEARAFSRLGINENTSDRFSYQVGHIQGLVAKTRADPSEVRISNENSLNGPDVIRQVIPTVSSKKVFIVHGHDNEAKEGTARFLDKIGLQPIILHEQASSGRTIIEKFETYSGDISFAIILLTPDDFGGIAGKPDSTRPRARQNVILELGYFIGKLGRSRVCALHKGGIEFPSDYQGVLYIELDDAGAWKTKLAQEFVEAKLTIDLTGLLNN